MTTALVDFTDTLRQHLTQCVQVMSYLFDSNYYILRTLERILVDGRSRSNSSDDMVVLTGIKQQLDNSVLHLYDTQPLFCHYVWHLVALIGDTGVG